MRANRRSFFAALIAPLFAKFIPKPTTTLSAYRGSDLNTIVVDSRMSLSLDRFSEVYLRPSLICAANQMDRMLIEQYNSMTNENGRYTHFRHPRGLDPNRLPV